MNKQSNLYTVIYIIVMVVIVGTALAFTSMALRDRQQTNIDADRMRQILASVHIVPEKANILAEYHRVITDSYVVDAAGQRVDGEAFNINVANEVRLPDAERRLPVYVATVADGSCKYILPVYGAGLWGPLWGYVALDADGSTVYGAYFNHQGETPGLGAEIAKEEFSSQFSGKQLFKGERLMPIDVVKVGQKPLDERDYVDGISGGTITSKGVAAMLAESLRPYENYLKTLSGK